VAREREVKAQIKMLFKAVTGKSIVATRSLQLTQKANAQQCKTIESALKTYNASGDVRMALPIALIHVESQPKLSLQRH
jgi:hypothetical protein